MLIYYFLPFSKPNWFDIALELDILVVMPLGGMASALGIRGSFIGLNVASLENLTNLLR